MLNEQAVLPRLLERLLETPERVPGRPLDRALDRADEVVVVDGGSADAGPELARQAGARVLSSAPGRGRQLAKGAEQARGKVLLFLHADCLPAPGALSEVRAAFAVEGARLCAMTQRVQADHRFYRLVERAADARARRGTVYGDSGLAVRADLYHECGGFRPLALFEDVDLSRRLAARARVRVLLGAQLLVSPRRWRREGALRCTLRNWILRGLYELGVPPARLARHYPQPAPTGERA